MRIFSKITILVFLAVFLVAGSVSALPFNTNRTGDVNISSPFGNEDSLQTILDNVIINNDINAITDQSISAAWAPIEGASTTYTVSMFTAANGSFGIYSLDNPNNSFELLNFTTGSNPVDGGVIAPVQPSSTFFADENGLLVNNTFYTAGDFSLFGFYFNDGNRDYFTEDELNGGNAEALTYLLDTGTEVDVDRYVNYLTIPQFTASGNNDWILAFDSGGNNDFNDAVFLLEDMATPVPEPATLFLLGSGLLGFAGSRRRKSKK